MILFVSDSFHALSTIIFFSSLHLLHPEPSLIDLRPSANNGRIVLYRLLSNI